MSVLYVWDFHGTLEEGTIKQAEYVTNKIRRENNLSILNKEDLYFLFGEHWLLWFKYKEEISNEYAEKMYNSAQKLALNTIKTFINPKAYAGEVLKNIKKNNGVNIVVSNTKLEKLYEYTEHTGLTEYFDYFIGNNDINIHEERVEDYKYKKVKNYLDNHVFEKIVCIGDQETDILLGKKLNKIIPTITYRIYDHEKPETTEADYIINDLRKIL